MSRHLKVYLLELWLRGNAATLPRGYVATRLRRYAATELRGYGAGKERFVIRLDF